MLVSHSSVRVAIVDVTILPLGWEWLMQGGVISWWYFHINKHKWFLVISSKWMRKNELELKGKYTWKHVFSFSSSMEEWEC